MLTIFSVPKPFHDHIGTIQRNAVESWLRLNDGRCQVILCGDEAGVAEVAAEMGVEHLPQLARTEYGTPLLSDAFKQVSACARYPLLCYANADIMLLPAWAGAVARIPFTRFLAVGRRWNLDVTQPIDFHDPSWDRQLRELARRQGVLHSWRGIDFFVFPKAAGLHRIPPFAVGRPGWDNWFIWRARAQKVPVIDLTPVTTVVHQNHDYSHVPQRRTKKWEGPEADHNRLLMGDAERRNFTVLDATYVLMPWGLAPAWGPRHLRRRLYTWPILHPGSGPVTALLAPVNRLLDRLT